MMGGMTRLTRPDAASVPRTLLAIATAFPRMLPRTAMLLAAVIGVMVAALAIAVTLAAPSAGQIAQALAQGTGTATLQLLMASAWWLLPLALMFVAMLTFTGMLMHFADAVTSGGRVPGLGALVSTLSRVHSAAMVAAIYLVAVVLAVVGAPLVSLLALLALAVSAVAQRRQRPHRAWMPTRRQAALLVIPFFAAGTLLARWSLAFGEVYLAGAGWRESFQASWRRTSGRAGHTAAVLAIVYGFIFVVSWGMMLLATLSGSIGVELGVQLATSLLVAPIPAITLLVLFRGAGGPRSPLAESVADAPRMSPRRFGASVPVAVSFTLMLTLLTPPSTATAAEDQNASEPAPTVATEQFDEEAPLAVETPPAGEPAPTAEPAPNAEPEPASEPSPLDDETPSLDGQSNASESTGVPVKAGGFLTGQAMNLPSFGTLALDTATLTLDDPVLGSWTWEFGNVTALYGQVTPDTTTVTPTGEVQLWGKTAGADAVAFRIGDPATLHGGEFDFSGTEVLPGTTTLWVEYGGDSQYAATRGTEQPIVVHRKVLMGSATVLHPTGTISVGDRVTLRVEVDPYDEAPPGQKPAGELELWNTAGSGTVLDSVGLVDGVAEFDFVMPARSVHLSTQGDDPRYGLYINGGEYVLQAEAGDSTTSLSVPQEIPYLSAVHAIAQVGAPAGVTATGTVQFSYLRKQVGWDGATKLGSPIAVTAGQASVSFCAYSLN